MSRDGGQNSLGGPFAVRRNTAGQQRLKSQALEKERRWIRGGLSGEGFVSARPGKE